MAYPGHDDPAASALPRALPAALVVEQRGAAGPRPLPRPATCATSRSGRTWRGSTRSLFEKDPSWPSSRPRAGTTPRKRSTGSWTSSAALLARVIPLHRELADRGQVELTTTPYYHPILPLLLDKTAGARGDARRHPAGLSRRLSRGRRRCTSAAPSRAMSERFGERPRGMWPSEGSVCQAMIPLLAEHGIQWIATDEEILGCSTHGKVGRDSRGHVRHPELLYRAWKVREAGSRAGDHLPRPLDVRPGRVPLPAEPGPGRRRRLPRQGPRDRRRLPARPGDARPGDPRRRELLGILPRRRRLVPPLALPGRSRDPRIRPGHGRRVPRASTRRHDTLHRLFAGSWISHNFAIWIGHPEDNRAWDALHAARAVPGRRGTLAAGTTPPTLARAWDEIYIAEGSDWFWWYGDDHSSALDGALRPPVPQAPAQRLHAARAATRRARCSRRSREAAPIARFTTSRSASSTSRSTAAPPTSSGSTRRGTSAATTAAR